MKDEKEYKSEAEFLKDYNKDEFEKLSLTTDIAVFSVSDGEKENYRRLNEKFFSVLLVKRNTYPFKDMWCTPGGFVGIDESIDDAAIRILERETNLKDIFVEQLYTFGDVNRDPRMRIVSTSYISLIDKNRLGEEVSEKASWFNVKYEEFDDRIEVTLDNGEEQINFIVGKKLKEHTTDRYKYYVMKNDKIAFDHAILIVSGIERIRNKLDYTDIVFNMMPEYFTLGELQQVYEAILNKKLLDPAFRRIIADKVEKTDLLQKGAGHRPSVLFKYKKK